MQDSPSGPAVQVVLLVVLLVVLVALPEARADLVVLVAVQADLVEVPAEVQVAEVQVAEVQVAEVQVAEAESRSPRLSAAWPVSWLPQPTRMSGLRCGCRLPIPGTINMRQWATAASPAA
jgi:hypothetical protein